MKRCSTLLIIREMQIATTYNEVSSHTVQKLQTINAGEGGRKEKSPTPFGGNVKLVQASMENSSLKHNLRGSLKN